MALSKGRICHCWDCKSAPSKFQGEWKRQHNRSTRREGRREAQREAYAGYHTEELFAHPAHTLMLHENVCMDFRATRWRRDPNPRDLIAARTPMLRAASCSGYDREDLIDPMYPLDPQDLVLPS